jgi:HEPN domain-containing protein
MKSLVSEWVAKAEDDFHTATRERRARRDPNPDAVCFHAQQSVEKYMKAWLLHYRVAFGRTHDLGELLHLCLPKRPMWELLRDSVLLLNQYAVEIRYPGESATLSEAREAYEILVRLRAEFRKDLRLP